MQCSTALPATVGWVALRFPRGTKPAANPEELLAGRPLKVPHSLCLVTFITSASPAGRCCSQSQPSLGEGQIRCQIHAKKTNMLLFPKRCQSSDAEMQKQPMKMKNKNFLHCLTLFTVHFACKGLCLGHSQALHNKVQ